MRKYLGVVSVAIIVMVFFILIAGVVRNHYVHKKLAEPELRYDFVITYWNGDSEKAFTESEPYLHSSGCVMQKGRAVACGVRKIQIINNNGDNK